MSARQLLLLLEQVRARLSKIIRTDIGRGAVNGHAAVDPVLEEVSEQDGFGGGQGDRVCELRKGCCGSLIDDGNIISSNQSIRGTIRITKRMCLPLHHPPPEKVFTMVGCIYHATRSLHKGRWSSNCN
jgi:hypothetical protein